jgi:uncharacterized protein YcgL (UPF0745 family)
MNTTQYLAEEDLIDKALTVLMQSLGPIETMRFLNLPRQRRLESVERHRQWQATLNQEEFFHQVFGSINHNDNQSTD